MHATFELDGHTIHYTPVSFASEQVDPKKFVLHPDSGDLYVGISTGAAHSYLVFNGQRYDGGLLASMTLASIRPRRAVTAGIILRFRQLSPEVQQKLGAYLAASRSGFSVTCSSGVCHVLEANGLQLPEGSSYFPTQMVSDLLRNGLKTRSGEMIRPEVYVDSSLPIEHHFARWSQSQKMFVNNAKMVASAAAALLVTVTAVSLF